MCREHGISEHTLYRWKKKYGGMEASDAKRLRRLEEENRKLKHTVADLTVPSRRNACWSMDFVHDRTTTGPLRTLSVLDLCTRQAPVLTAAGSMPSERVIRILEQAAKVHGLPERIVVDNGPEFTSRA